LIEVKKGDVYWAELPKLDKSNIQWGIRPIIITANDFACKYSPVVQYVPVTTKLNKYRLPVHVPLESKIFKEKSIALVEQQGCIDKHRLRGYIGKLCDVDLVKLENAILKQQGIDVSKLYFNVIHQYNYA